MTDEEYLEAVRRACAESVSFFESGNRGERELWVAREFLLNTGLCFGEDELKWVKDDPPDVRFREAEFEIKEILDPGRHRHTEFKMASRRAEAATAPADLLEEFTPRDTTIGDVVSLVQARARELTARKYPAAVVRKLDLLFYVNLDNVFGLTEAPFPDTATVASLGWRSVSFLMGHRSCVLVTTSSAPTFLQTMAGRIVHRSLGK